MVNTKESVRNNYLTLKEVYDKNGSLEPVMNEESYKKILGWKFGNRYNVIGRVLSLLNVIDLANEFSDGGAKFVEELKVLRSAAADKSKDEWSKTKPKNTKKTDKKVNKK